MLNYIIISITALMAFPFALLLIKKGRIPRSSLFFIASGLVVALIGILIGQNYPFYYSVLLMFGLAFIFSVLLDKRLVKNEVIEKVQKESDKNMEREDSELEQFVKMEETAATIEEDEFNVENPVDEDLKLWMSDDLEKEYIPDGEEVNRGK